MAKNFSFKNAREKQRILFKTLKLSLSCSHSTYDAWWQCWHGNIFIRMICFRFQHSLTIQKPSMEVGSGFLNVFVWLFIAYESPKFELTILQIWNASNMWCASNDMWSKVQNKCSHPLTPSKWMNNILFGRSCSEW